MNGPFYNQAYKSHNQKLIFFSIMFRVVIKKGLTYVHVIVFMRKNEPIFTTRNSKYFGQLSPSLGVREE